jgi:pimeloyl-ACP methyl ester carboxylesterase
MGQVEVLMRGAPAGERDRLLADLAGLAAIAQAHDPLEDGASDLPVDAAGHADTWADVLRLQERGVEPARFREIRCPVLMIHGADDPHPGPATRDTLAAVMPQLEYVEIPRCGHTPWLERAGREPFLATLVPWLRLHSRPG